MSTDLDFAGSWASPTGAATDLDFARQQSSAPQAASATVHIGLSGPSVRIRAQYNNQVSRKLEGGGRLGWQRAQWQAGVAAGGWAETGRDRGTTSLLWRGTEPSSEGVSFPSGENVSERDVSGLAWDDAARVAVSTTERINPLAPRREQLGLRWAEGAAFASGVTSAFVWLVPQARHHALPWQMSSPQTRRWQFGFAPGVWKSARWGVPWALGRQPRGGESHLPVEPPGVAPPPNHHPNLDLICPAVQRALLWRPGLLLDFGAHPCPAAGDGVFSVPILKVYYVSNSVQVVRLPGREPVPVKSIQIGIDSQSWAWGLSASLPYSALDLIEPTSGGPVELEIAINGVTWVMLVENFDVHRLFGHSTLAIRGRSRAAYLAEPYAPRRSFVPTSPFTARQLAEQELTRSGLVSAFDLDWRLPDWLVPEGSWSYQGMSPVGVINRIAESVGGYVNAHPQAKTLIAKSRYPELPWNWASVEPARVLPLDVVKTLNLRWQEKPAFNAVFVSGERQGYTGRVLRSGTAGDLVAPMVVDGLMTHADAIRERGHSILADVGKQAVVTLELPMLASLGLLDPGLLIAVGEGSANPTNPASTSHWRGLVRSTNIEADWSESLTVRQTLEVERHYL